MRLYWLVLLSGVFGCEGAIPVATPLSPVAANSVPLPREQAPGTAGSNSPARAPAAAPPATRDKEALYQRSCDLGSAVGCNDLGIRHWEEPKRARELLERACSLGLTQGCANLAMLLLPEAKERSRALQLLEGACKADNAHACVHLGDALYEDPREWSKAKTSYESACKMDDADGCQSVGWMVLRGEGTRARADRAAEWFRIPCERDVFDACAGLGFALLDDSASKSQADQGKHWLQVACEHDSAFGCLMAARRAAFEAQQLTPESRALFAKACRLGSKTACAEAQESEAPEGHSDAEESDSESD